MSAKGIVTFTRVLRENARRLVSLREPDQLS